MEQKIMTTFGNQTNEPKPRVAVIGTGTMGTAVAHRLLGSKLDVRVWSRHPESAMPLLDLGATAFAKAADAVTDADVVITMLPTAAATADVMFGAQTLDAMAPKSTWVQMATIGVQGTEKLVSETWTRRPGITFVDAPVSGSREPAETGELLILASGPRPARQLLEPVFEVLGRSTLWLGPAGNGSRMKLVLNTWLAFQTEGAAEAAALANRLGVRIPALFTALRDNPLASPYALGKLARMVEQDYHADFALDWALKDLDLVASDAGIGVAPVASAIADRWRGLVRNGSSGLDVSAARNGLGPGEPVRPNRRSPELRIMADRVSAPTTEHPTAS
jgi:3-hydroxyisobutyrate dehydrogenase